MTNDDRNSLTADQTEPDKTPELSDLTRLFKNRCRDGDIMQKCKHFLIAGMPPGKVSLVLRLPLERVQELYNSSYNPRCRRFCKPNNGKLVLTSFNEGAMLDEICAVLGLPLYTVITSLRHNGVAESAINARMPPYDNPLTVEYRRVVTRKAASKFKPIQINPVRHVRKSQQASQ